MSGGAPGLAAGSRVGPYHVVALLGRGGMGEVYRARDVRLSRDVALKVLHADVAADSARVRRFGQEAKAAGVLNHPNIVAVYDAGESDQGSPYIVSELLEGETLRARLATGGLGVRKAVEYAAQVARGLAAAHERGIVHRDLKPENLFVTKDGIVKILDFGVAKLGRPGDESLDTKAETQSETSPGTVLGTMGYMSPEQARGLVADHRSDVFSLGAVLLEMLTGRRAFKGTTPADTLSAILKEDPTERFTAGSDLPTGVLRVARRCLEKAPEDRFQSARDLAFALEGTATEPKEVTQEATPGSRRPRLRWALFVVPSALAILGVGILAGRLMSEAPAAPPTFQRLTFRLGRVLSAVFARDGETILYSAAWGSQPSEVFSTRTSSRESRPLGITDAKVLAVSSSDEMALLLRPKEVTWEVDQGTLARASVGGGAPREVADDVLDADWSPDGKDLALVQVVEGGTQLQFPPGHVLYAPEAPRWISSVRVSPRGDRMAFIEHAVTLDIAGDLRVVDLNGRVTTLAAGFTSANRMAWSADGGAVWLTATRSGGDPQQIHSVTLTGHERVAVEGAGGLILMDMSRSGQVLVRRGTGWTEVRARAKGAPEEAELPAADLSFLSDLADDGSRVLGTDIGQGSGPNYRFYVQGTDGSAPVWLGEGDGQALSPDGRLALALLTRASPQQLLVVPTRAGQASVLEPGPVTEYRRAVWDPTGRRVVFCGGERQGDRRIYVQDVRGGPPRPVSPLGVELAKKGRPVSPDGTRVVASGPDGIPALYPLAGGEPVAIPGLKEEDVPLCFTPDGRELFVARYEETPPLVERVEIASGRRRPWTGMRRGTPSGLSGEYHVLVTPDGQSYAYSYFRIMSDVYLATGLK